MTIVVLLILAAVWAAVLVPPLLRDRAERRPADSIGSFRHQLNVLQRTGPHIVAPANQLRVATPATASWVPPVAAAPLQSRAERAEGRRAPSSRAEAMRRHNTIKRRRDVLFTLAGSFAGSLVLGFIPGLHAVWVLTLLTGLLLGAYVAVLVQLRNLAAERDMKLRFLPANNSMTFTPAPAHANNNGLLLRRSGS